jgi:hypothetical protein
LESVTAAGQTRRTGEHEIARTAPWRTSFAPHNARYVNPSVRGTLLPPALRFSSTVFRPGPITRFVAKRRPVASDFDRIASLDGDGFR